MFYCSLLCLCLVLGPSSLVFALRDAGDGIDNDYDSISSITSPLERASEGDEDGGLLFKPVQDSNDYDHGYDRRLEEAFTDSAALLGESVAQNEICPSTCNLEVDFGEGGGKKIYTKSCLEWIAILSENTVWRFTCEDLEQMFGCDCFACEQISENMPLYTCNPLENTRTWIVNTLAKHMLNDEIDLSTEGKEIYANNQSTLSGMIRTSSLEIPHKAVPVALIGEAKLATLAKSPSFPTSPISNTSKSSSADRIMDGALLSVSRSNTICKSNCLAHVDLGDGQGEVWHRGTCLDWVLWSATAQTPLTCDFIESQGCDCSGCYEFAVDSNTYTCEPIIPAGSIHALSIDWPLSYSPGATNLNGAPFYVTNMSGPDGGSEATPLLLGQRDHLQFHAIMHMNASHNIMLELEQSERTYDNMTERETQDLNGCYATCQIGNTIASCLDWTLYFAERAEEASDLRTCADLEAIYGCDCLGCASAAANLGNYERFSCDHSDAANKGREVFRAAIETLNYGGDRESVIEEWRHSHNASL